MLEKWFGKKEDENVTAAPEIATGEITPLAVEQEVKIVTSDNTVESTPQVSNDVNAKIEQVETIPEPEAKLPPITYKEIRALKKARYEEDIINNPKCSKAYILMNKKTGQIVEIKAFSSFHACNIIGWKTNKVRVLGERDLQAQVETTTLAK